MFECVIVIVIVTRTESWNVVRSHPREARFTRGGDRRSLSGPGTVSKVVLPMDPGWSGRPSNTCVPVTSFSGLQRLGQTCVQDSPERREDASECGALAVTPVAPASGDGAWAVASIAPKHLKNLRRGLCVAFAAVAILSRRNGRAATAHGSPLVCVRKAPANMTSLQGRIYWPLFETKSAASRSSSSAQRFHLLAVQREFCPLVFLCCAVRTDSSVSVFPRTKALLMRYVICLSCPPGMTKD